MKKIFLTLSLMLFAQQMNAALEACQAIGTEVLKVMSNVATVTKFFVYPAIGLVSACIACKCYEQMLIAHRMIKVQKQQINTTVSPNIQKFLLKGIGYQIENGVIKIDPYQPCISMQADAGKVVDVSVVKNKFRKWAAGGLYSSFISGLSFYGLYRLIF